ncbi:hypothetical protein ABR738_01235 [Streptomyces sp. Edi4]|uniref:hypothetical protein n=1 Tax=Streptomyces sp. Edi4 TaxID=3162527 RepID=UPI0033061C2F
MTVTPLPKQPEPEITGQAAVPEPGALRRWWASFTRGGGWLDRRLEEILDAPFYGWRPLATWIKTAVALLVLALTLGLMYWIGSAVFAWVSTWSWPTVTLTTDDSGLMATMTDPVRHYLATRTTELPVSAATVYGTWETVGLVAFVLGFFRYSGARITWVLWGAATGAMVWYGTPVPGREVTVGITALAWGIASVLALRGLSLRPSFFTHVHYDVHPPAVHPEIHIHIHMPKPETATVPFDAIQHGPGPSLN